MVVTVDFVKSFQYRFFFPLLAKLPARIAYVVIVLPSLLRALLDKKSRRGYVVGYISVFPKATRFCCWKIWIKACIMQYTEILDVYFLPSIKSPTQGKVNINLKGIDALLINQKQKRGTLIAMGHYGRLPLFSTGLALAGVPVGFVTQRIDERNIYLSKAERSYLAKKLDSMCRIAGGRWIVLDDPMFPLYSGLKKGESIIVLFDLPLKKNSSHRGEFSFLKGTLNVPNSIQRIAEKTGAQIVYGSVKDVTDGVEVSITPLDDKPEKSLEGAVRALESDVYDAPWQWWQWPVIPQIWSKKG